MVLRLPRARVGAGGVGAFTVVPDASRGGGVALAGEEVWVIVYGSGAVFFLGVAPELVGAWRRLDLV